MNTIKFKNPDLTNLDYLVKYTSCKNDLTINYKKKIIVRYEKENHNLIQDMFTEEINMNIKTIKKKDPENTEKYNFNMIMEYDNTNGVYNRCCNIVIYYNDDIIKEYIVDYFKKHFTHTSITSNKTDLSINLCYVSPPEGYFTCGNDKPLMYPLNILSLGRYNDKTGHTHKLLSKLQLIHYMFVEKDEYDDYSKWINHDYCCLIEVDNFSYLKQGSQHVRNEILRYWRLRNMTYVWMLDDNIKGYKRLYNDKKYDILSPEIFTSVEHFTLFFNNIGCLSHNITSGITRGLRTCLVKNGKQFSSLLINITTNINFRFKYNEDHIFSIDNICNNYITVCFNHIQYNKNTSGTEKGGNSQIYKTQEHGNYEGYNNKYFETYELLEREVNNGYIKLNTTDITKFLTNKSKKNKPNHLVIDYRRLQNNDLELNSNNKEWFNFDSDLLLV